ncbi:PQQ-dependent sugar dehydrogenase [Bizionia argentinensis JUB59]|uniref:PQQ-dependent sugar dehydrogenase n=1 Tax=Bizionia argentinensis JUB59 TaxID=1046627 RepID=G2EB20_9FLAO|nr:PQQ-dependent sugar dehydrogenase [Bizionia argentinensis]EGV44462.1 PQQ-dependent sugar dehydrogenase [Bizionia argentinensis JUB59]
MKSRSYLLFFITLNAILACAQDKNPLNTNHSHEVIVPDLNIPWGFVFLPDNSMLITEKAGELIHFKNGKKISISGLPKILVYGQGGLMDIALHPDYKNNGWIYFSYASAEGIGNGGHTAIARGKLNKNQLTDLQVLYKASPNTEAGQHFGSRIVLGANNYLYFSIGDRGQRDINPQDLSRDGGKIYRLHHDGSIPKDNPFVDISNAKKATYSYGHRNTQGMTIHPKTFAIWSHEHGPKGGDEINIIKAGENYGWPEVTYGKNYSGTEITNQTLLPGITEPIHYWDPSIAPSGMAFITSNVYPEWTGNLLIGSLKFQYLDNCYLKDNKVIKEERLLDGLGRIRSVVQGPDGYIYVGIENLGIVKIIQKDK